MDLDLSDEQAAALLSELDRIIDNDRGPFSPRIRTLKERTRRKRFDHAIDRAADLIPVAIQAAFAAAQQH